MHKLIWTRNSSYLRLEIDSNQSPSSLQSSRLQLVSSAFDHQYHIFMCKLILCGLIVSSVTGSAQTREPKTWRSLVSFHYTCKSRGSQHSWIEQGMWECMHMLLRRVGCWLLSFTVTPGTAFECVISNWDGINIPWGMGDQRDHPLT